MEVFCLRVGKDTAGKSFPFDRVYIVNHDDRAVIEQLFRYALVLPIEGVLREQLESVQPREYRNRTFHRDDEENAAAKISQTDWKALFQDGSWIMTVPLLPKWMKKNMPQYLVAEGWYARKTEQVRGKGRVKQSSRESPFTNMAYLQTPHKKIRPICVVCPRMVLHQNGDCNIGDKVCFESLPLGMVNHFEESLALPEHDVNVNEPEAYKMAHDDDELIGDAPPTKDSAKTLLRIIHD